MKITLKQHFFGDTRIIKRFLLFPFRFKNKIYWLQSLTRKQKYVYDGMGDCCWKTVKIIKT